MASSILNGCAGVVTGAASGIGAATAKELARCGARVALADMAAEPLTAIADQIRGAGGEAVTAIADVRHFEAMLAVRDACLQAYGRLDFAVLCAGIAEASSMADGDPEVWRNVIETNVLGTAYSIRAMLPVMQEQKSGHIVMVASSSGRVTYVGEPIYLASKWAVVGLGRALRQEALRYGVRVTLVEPGCVDTPLSRATPLGRTEIASIQTLSADDVARSIVFAMAQPHHATLSELLIQPLMEA